MVVPQAKSLMTPEEYLRRERAALDKSEFFGGEIFAMAGASPQHALLSTRVLVQLGNLLKGHRCTAYNNDLRIKVPESGLYTYPDASVICGPIEFPTDGDDMATNPTLIVEVLSDSTEAYDRGKKFALYRTLSSLAEYVLVSQREPLIEVFFRLSDDTWRLTPVRGLDAAAPLQSLGVTLPLSEIYEGVEFPPIASLKPVAK